MARGETPTRRGKPPGTRGANVYSFVGPSYPADPSGWRYEGATTKNKLDVLFPDSAAGGTQVWICATWFNATRDAERNASIEQVGAKLRALMPFLKPVTTEETIGTR